MIERRFVKGAEIRAKDDGHIEGHAAVFDQQYVLWEMAGYRVVEIIKKGAFARALKEKQDVRCLFNHDPNQLLGRTAAGTMELKEDDTGLYYDTELPDTQLGRDLPVLIKRGDVTGSSFGFTVTKETITEEKTGDTTVRTRQIEDVDLWDASPVTYPAYTGTDVNARARELRGQMFPTGVPESVLKLVPELRDEDHGVECNCGCRACFSADCDECEINMADCGDEQNCDHSLSGSARSARAGDAPTKRVAGEDLTSGCFIYVGDPQKPATWALPWKFKSTAKIKSHLRNALARFNQTAKIPADSKAAAWKKLVRLAKKYGVKVSDQESKAWVFTAEQRADPDFSWLRLSDAQRDTIGGGTNCECDCPECLVGDCEHCSEPGCEDDQCSHGGGADEDDRAAALLDIDARLRRAGLKPTA